MFKKDFVFQTLFANKSFSVFLIGVILGLAFSISIVLSTVGVMDGFIKTLKVNLKKHSGDIVINSRETFFDYENDIKKPLNDLGLENHFGYISIEGFAVTENSSKGVLINGVNTADYQKVVGQDLKLKEGIIVGDELLNLLGLKIGEELVLAFSQGNREYEGLPTIESFVIDGVVDQGIYQKDSRVIYLKRKNLEKILRIKDRYNTVSLSLANDPNIFIEDEKIEESIGTIRNKLGPYFYVRPYWREFATTLEAVKMEKYLIGIVFQIIVIISIFNVLAFITFVTEKKAQDVFLLRALGLSNQGLIKIWNKFCFVVWIMACMTSLIFVKAFNYILESGMLIDLPDEVYSLGKLSIELEYMDYVIVFGSCYLWLYFITWLKLKKQKKESAISGLRKEFA